jgi:hypothetical protein
MDVQNSPTDLLAYDFALVVNGLETKQVKSEEVDVDMFTLIRLELEKRHIVTFH